MEPISGQEKRAHPTRHDKSCRGTVRVLHDVWIDSELEKNKNIWKLRAARAM